MAANNSMEVKIVGKNVEITEAMKETITAKVKKLERYSFIENNDTAKVLIKTHKNSQKVEITIPTKIAILRAEVQDVNAYPAVDKAIDKLSDQIRRQKTRIEKRNRKPIGEIFDFEEQEKEKIIRTKSINVQKMDVEDAIMRMELLGHDFFVYVDEENNYTSVLYKRHNDEYGVLEIQ